MERASLTGRVALVTGASSGIGLATARELARRGARVFIACRSEQRAGAAVRAIAAATGNRVEPLALDLADLDSVHRCATDWLARSLPLHLLINNAGLAGQRGLTRSGFELAFGTNHIGHFLLTRLLLERLRQSAPARVVTVSSRAHWGVRGINWEAVREPTRSRSGFVEYSTSKLANLLFSAELARRTEGTGVTTYAPHPGMTASGIWRRVPGPLSFLMKLPMKSVERGASTLLHCALAPELEGESGAYYVNSRVAAPSWAARDRALMAELWRRSEAWTS